MAVFKLFPEDIMSQVLQVLKCNLRLVLLTWVSKSVHLCGNDEAMSLSAEWDPALSNLIVNSIRKGVIIGVNGHYKMKFSW